MGQGQVHVEGTAIALLCTGSLTTKFVNRALLGQQSGIHTNAVRLVLTEQVHSTGGVEALEDRLERPKYHVIRLADDDQRWVELSRADKLRDLHDRLGDLLDHPLDVIALHCAHYRMKPRYRRITSCVCSCFMVSRATPTTIRIAVPARYICWCGMPEILAVAMGRITLMKPRKQAPAKVTRFITGTAAFHFGYIEQGGASLYSSLALKVRDLEVLRIVISIGGVEVDHFGLWHGLGQDTSSTRTTDQTQQAQFWAGPIQNTWNEIADNAALAHHINLETTSRLLATLNLTFADSVIAFYDAKYHYAVWRPITAIRLGDSIGNMAIRATRPGTRLRRRRPIALIPAPTA